jgi:subtilisin family serine protease
MSRASGSCATLFGFVAVAFVSTAAAQDVPQALAAKAQQDPVVRVIVRLATPFATEARMGREAVQNQRAAISAAQTEVAETVPGALVDTFESLPLAVFEVDAAQLDDLAQSDLVEAVYEDTLAEPFLLQSSPLIHAPAAWAAGYSGAGLAIAVLDTGIDSTHPFLTDKVVSQACFSTTSAANGGSQSLCPNGAGSQTGGNAGRDCQGIAGCDHGTHVAGIAAGNGPSFSGVAREASLIAVQVFSRFNESSACSPRPAPCVLSYTSDQIRGLERVRDLAGTFQIASVNMSLGGGKFASACDSDPRKPIMDELRALGIATVVASGNNGFDDGIGTPSCISSAISVGSATKSDVVSTFSNSAAILDLLAPGEGINSSVPGGGFGVKNGTSMATPQVAGAFAVERSAFPADSVTQLLDRLKATGVSVTGKGVTKPRIDLAHVVPINPSGNAPLAFGTVWFSGAKQTGTANWSSTFNPTYNRYEIAISGENYYYLNYSTIVTPAGDVRFCKSSSVGGKLLVYCYDSNGNPATSRFAFVTYKP